MPDERLLKELEQNGIWLLDYIAKNTYVAGLPVDFKEKKLSQLRVNQIAQLPLEYKLSNKLLQEEIPIWAISKNDILVHLKFHKNISAKRAQELCIEAGINVLKTNDLNNIVRASISKDKIKEFAALPFISYIDLIQPPSTPDNEHGRAMHRSNVLYSNIPTERKYNGENIHLLCRDDGAIGPHIDFHGRVDNSFANNPNVLGGEHGDGVSGIMAGAGNLNPVNIGMAPEATIFTANYTADFLDATMNLHLEKDVLVTNTSYSNGCNSGYTLTTEIVDQQLFNHPTLMHVFSAGNSNSLNCDYGAGDQWGNITGGHKQAKNCLTIANLNPDGSLAETSSRGPAHDGRIKPDLSAFGEGHTSTAHHHAYQSFTGTSAAAPVVSGVLAQLHHAYQELFNGKIAEAGLLKACLLNTADDLGNEGPDYQFGWGQVNALRAVKTLEQQHFIRKEISPGQNQLLTFTIPSGVEQANFMVYWPDNEASTLSNVALLNNLDVKLIDQNFEKFYPWVLDPSPESVLNNTAATKGIDDLNNMEQITINAPDAGNYTLQVFGKEMPFGNTPYFIVWEFRTHEMTVTYPMGGESFLPEDTIDIHWETVQKTGHFEISYSNDGGQSFETIAIIPATENRYKWILPNELTGKGRIQVRHMETNEIAISQASFSIAPTVQNLLISKACPDFITLKWAAVDLGNTSVVYEVFLLGEKYMDKIGTTDFTEFQIPTIQNNPTKEHWVAVKAIGQNGITTNRSNAILYKSGLLNCGLQHDLELVKINAPSNGNIFGCSSVKVPVELTYKNNGSAVENNIHLAYKINGGNAIVENTNESISPGETKTFVFSDSIHLSGSENIFLETFTVMANDGAAFNNSKNHTFNSSIYDGEGKPLDYIESFESSAFPPPYFIIENADNDLTWTHQNVLGADGEMTQCMYINNYAYSSVGEEDAFVSVPIDLNNSNYPFLQFDVAYAQYSTAYSDGLKVLLSVDCGATFDEVVFEKHGVELATAANHNQLFSPENIDEWRKEEIDLTPYKGHSIVLKFINLNGYGNALYVDNIEVKNRSHPTADFQISDDKVCVNESIVFSALNIGNNVSYNWDFGNGAVPSTSDSVGPVEVFFSEQGLQNITLTVSDGVEINSYSKAVEIQSEPIPGFDFFINDNLVDFQNSSKYADSAQWDFGDGQSSDEFSPTHTYNSIGNFPVILRVENTCGSSETGEVAVSIIVNDVDLTEFNTKLLLYPNPTKDEVHLKIDSSINHSIEIGVYNMVGQVMECKKEKVSVGQNTYLIETKDFVSGTYFVRLKNKHFYRTLKLVVVDQ